MPIIPFFKKLFRRLRWYEQAEYAVMLLTMAAAPLSWQVGVIGMILLGLVTVAKIVATRHAGNPALGESQRWAFVAMIAFFGIHLVWGFFSANRALGWEVAFREISFLALPLIALLGDTRYLTRDHMRTLFYTLGVTLSVTFLVCTVIAVCKMIGGATFNSTLDHHFFPTHHTYVALYLIVAMAFGYTEIMEQIEDGRFSFRSPLTILLLTGELLLTLFALAVNSRVGTLLIVLLALVAVADMVLTTRSWRNALIAFGIIAVVGGGLYALEPASRHRLTKTVKDVTNEYPNDARVMLWNTATETILREMGDGRWIVGLGTGDYLDYLYERHAAHGYKDMMDAHNQYLGTFLGCGAIGLFLMLWMLTAPLWAWKPAFRHWRRQRALTYARPVPFPRLAPAIVLPILLAIATESILGRMMGIFFTAYIYYLLILWKPTTTA